MMFSMNQMLRGFGGREYEKMNFRAISLVDEALRQGNNMSL